MLKKNNRVLVLAIILFVLSFAFILEGFPDTTGAFKLSANREPDLQITNVVTSTTDITVDITNAGLTNAKGFVVQFYERASGTVFEWEDIGNEYVPRLASKKDITLVHEWNQKYGGERDIKIVLDREDKVKEADESNNNFTIREKVTSVTPDIYIRHFNVRDNLVSAYIYNSGGDVDEEFVVSIYKIDARTEIIGSTTVNGIKGGNKERRVVSFKFTPSKDKYVIRATADINTAVAESENNRENNYLKKCFIGYVEQDC